MKDETALTVRPESSSGSLLEVIAKAVSDPRIDVSKMERLLAMHKEIVAEERRIAFAAAMSRLQEKLPQINKNGRIVVKGTERSRYAKLEDIDVAIKPLLAEEGFAFSFDSDSSDGKLFKLSCKLSHREGHAETKYLVLPIDANEYRSNVQSIGSTVSYGKRQLIKMHLNLIERDEDTDGHDLQTLSEEQAKDLEALADEVGANKRKFLEYMGVISFDTILLRDLRKAITALETKRRGPHK